MAIQVCLASADLLHTHLALAGTRFECYVLNVTYLNNISNILSMACGKTLHECLMQDWGSRRFGL